jgi:hypothetical protein
MTTKIYKKNTKSSLELQKEMTGRTNAIILKTNETWQNLIECYKTMSPTITLVCYENQMGAQPPVLKTWPIP